MNQKSFYRRNRSLLILALSVSLCLSTLRVLAQEAPPRSFSESPFLRIDPDKIRGAEVCGECHAEEAAVWSETRHQTQFATLHRSEKAQNILDNMGFRLAKRESLCLRCHYTATIRRNQARAVTGVSCESCHGAGRAMSRHKARKAARGRSIASELEKQGIYVQASSRRTIDEEIPEAYKDVASVVDACQLAGISKKVVQLKPLGCIKG